MSLVDDPDGLTAANAATPLVLRRYRLGRRLGAGGFGAVHEAHDERLDRRVAIKVIPADGAAPERGRREAMAAARLEHPGIVALFDAGEDADARYLVSELVEGSTLAALEASGELTDRDVLRIGLSLCDALSHAHARGVVHRDVKPQNVIVPDRPRTWRGAAKLTDFGVAMLAGDESITRTGDVVGTLAYMAPEQAKGKPVDARADVYALALVLYEALAGANPVRGATPAETAKRIGAPVPPLGKKRRDLPPELVATIDRALKVNPALRPTLGEVGDALEDALLDVPEEDGRTLVRRHPVEREPLLASVPAGAPRVAHGLAVAALVAGVGWLGSVGSGFSWGAGGAGVWPWLGAALGVGLVAVLLPRAGWLLGVAVLALGLVVAPGLGAGPAPSGPGAATAGDVAAAGTAMAVLLACLPVPVLLLRRPRAWTVPLAAPLLGAIGLAGAYPALALRARTAWTRAALGALGAWWLLLATPLAGRALLLGDPRPDSAAAHGGATLLGPGADRAREAVTPVLDAVAAATTGGTLALVALWAVAAVVLPWLVRGWSLATDAVAATAWSAALAAGTGELARALGTPVPRGLVAGAVVAGLVAVALGAAGLGATLRSSDADDAD